MKLVDTLEEQLLLEHLIEATKPAIPEPCRHLHYLLSTPFRYGAPYPTGSRFRRSGHSPGVFYGSRAPETAIAEMAFHRLLFYAASPATPWPSNAGEYTVFACDVRTRAAIDLTRAPFTTHEALWMHPTNYAACQQLADDGRTAGVQGIVYRSVRDPNGRLNVALLTCAAFSAAQPVEHQTWRLNLGPQGVRAFCAFPETRLAFDRHTFAADPRVASMQWHREGG